MDRDVMDNMNKQIKRAVVTGATQGIGKAVVEKLLAEGYAITICARTLADLEQCKDAWLSAYPEAEIYIVAVDFSNPDDVKLFAEECKRVNSTLDILVNNAGIFYPGDMATEAEGHLEELMQVNLFSAYHLTRVLLPMMKENRRGHIFNLCSVASLAAYPNGGAYSVTKYALLGFSDNLHYELKPFGIKVTSVCPGPTMSRSWEGAGVDEDKILRASDVAEMIWSASQLSPQACVERIDLSPL